MKHKPKIIAIILGMFILSQFIGLYVINYYATPSNPLPLGMGYSQADIGCSVSILNCLVPIIFGFIIAISLFLLLTKIKAAFFLKLWFFAVVVIGLIVSFVSFFPGVKNVLLYSAILALVFGFFKVYKRNIIVHNLTELIIYPGIAAVFVPILDLPSILILLVLISVYDMWAVWHSGIMQKIAKYQINNLKIFSGFFVPYMSDKVRLQLQKFRKLHLSKNKLKAKKLKISVAILGGGDVVFPIITAGVVLVTLGPVLALFVVGGATLGLLSLFIYSEKRKFYPAMPFITAGIFLGLLVGWLVSLI